MKVLEYAQKQPWIRKTVYHHHDRLGSATQMEQMDMPCTTGRIMTQEDFEAEKHPTSHKIYDVAYRSNRPLYKYNELTGKNEPNGCEPVARVSVALQQAILRNKTTHAFGNQLNIVNESGLSQTTRVDRLRSHWNSTGMNDALVSWAESCFGTADGAICLYRTPDRELRYKVFSYDNGDRITEFINPDDGFRRNVIRLYKERGIDAVEIYKSTHVQRWIKTQEDDPIFKKWYRRVIGTQSEDGYILVSEAAHGWLQCPVAYHREPDVAWGPGQKQIEDIESQLSDLHENNKGYAFAILFLTGQIISMPQLNSQNKVLVSKNKEGDAKLIAPADASNSFSLALKTSFDMLCHTTGSRFMLPEDFKGTGDPSGAAITNLYHTEAQWSKQAHARFSDDIRTLLSIFKEGVGNIEEERNEYMGLRLSYTIEPWVPKNHTEIVSNLQMSVTAGILSKLTASERNPYAASDEEERIAKEIADATEQERLKAEQDAERLLQQNNPIDGRLQTNT